jgi:hypothetical protein
MNKNVLLNIAIRLKQKFLFKCILENLFGTFPERKQEGKARKFHYDAMTEK